MTSRLAIFVCFSILVLGCARAPATPAPAAPTPITYVGLGDSVTAGFGASPNKDYFTLVGASLQTRFSRVSTCNLAMSGSTSLDLESTQLVSVPRGDPNTPGWVVITTGGNDLIHAYGRMAPREGAMYGATETQAKPWIESFGVRMKHIVKTLEDDYPAGCEIFIANIFDPTDGKGDIEHAPIPLPAWKDGLALLAAYNRVIEGLPKGDPHVHVVDIRGRFLGHGIHHGALPYWYFVNLEDPNDDGYAAIHQAFMEQIDMVLAGRSQK